MQRNNDEYNQGDYEYPQRSVRLEEGEIRMRAQSLRRTSTPATRTSRVGGAAVSTAARLLGLLRIPLAVLAALVTFALVNGMESSNWLVALAVSFAVAVAVFILTAVIRYRMDRSRYRVRR
jgi:hypothetical protein